MGERDAGTVLVSTDRIIEVTENGENDLYLFFRITHPQHGDDPTARVGAVRRARGRMEHGLPQVGPGYMLSVSGQGLYLTDDGPILNVGVYDRGDVRVALTQLAESLEESGWSGSVTLASGAERAGATYLPDDRQYVPPPSAASPVYGAPRPPVGEAQPGRVVVDEARIEHSWQEGVDTNYGWLRLHCPTEDVQAAAVAMANALPAVAQSVGGNTTDLGRSDYVGIGPVQLSPVGPFVGLDDIGDFHVLRAIIRGLAGQLEREGFEGVLTILDHCEGRP
jgi:hypothetical protein